MARWREFESLAPTLAAAGRRIWGEIDLAYIATVSRQGWPRVHPIVVVFVDASLALIEMKHRGVGHANLGVDIGRTDFAGVAGALGGHGVAVDDAANDVRTREFATGYLDAFGIRSILNVPIRLHGELAGVICHEHMGPPREWTLEEQDSQPPSPT